ncbi:Glu/Leu/Phe/Val dehydrogenase [Candidatus Woesearchaeota archaeon]|nr:MAG: glutamate dehydrogenase NAD(P)+ [archaeon GW2011_AR4]MBS3130652.1 Glu/Leu/Phe/Val dehydrogenase [Candidatus Woesearchaeota archaeon]HIH37953.1 Glu/Leu/Phe/Val dehydrogenase [Candidatus Woesearchaeota archaeon]HIJ03732.1 Glu/Leu/Phe/Val dehydrogenase [Candidatus Woesearchaeota archaeon]
MVNYDEWGPELVFEVYDQKTGMKGVVVIDNTALGPGKGGIRMTKTVSTEEVAGLARAMTWKNALAGLPFGGAKGGIIADPGSLTREEKDELVVAFARAIKPICPSKYIGAPDVNTAEREMALIADTIRHPEAVTGKPSNYCDSTGKRCGLPHELGSTGLGVMYATLLALQHRGESLKGKRIAVEGFGNVGQFAAKYLTEAGAILIAVSDSKGMITDKKGVDVNALLKIKQEKGSVTSMPHVAILPHGDIISQDVDIIIPAAMRSLITVENYQSIKARIIVSGSNLSMSPDVEDLLFRKGILVVPDFVANAGGVISSYIEYIGGKEEDMRKLIKEKITENTKEVIRRSTEKNISPRDAGLEIAKERIERASH